MADRKIPPKEDPYTLPDCWVGWEKENVTKPYVKMRLDNTYNVSDILLRTYISDGEASPFGGVIVRTSPNAYLYHFKNHVDKDQTMQHFCTPETLSKDAEPRVVDIVLHNGGIVAESIKIEMKYSGDMIFLRRVTIFEGLLDIYFKPQCAERSGSPFIYNNLLINPLARKV